MTSSEKQKDGGEGRYSAEVVAKRSAMVLYRDLIFVAKMCPSHPTLPVFFRLAEQAFCEAFENSPNWQDGAHFLANHESCFVKDGQEMNIWQRQAFLERPYSEFLSPPKRADRNIMDLLAEVAQERMAAGQKKLVDAGGKDGDHLPVETTPKKIVKGVFSPQVKVLGDYSTRSQVEEPPRCITFKVSDKDVEEMKASVLEEAKKAAAAECKNYLDGVELLVQQHIRDALSKEQPQNGKGDLVSGIDRGILTAERIAKVVNILWVIIKIAIAISLLSVVGMFAYQFVGDDGVEARESDRVRHPVKHEKEIKDAPVCAPWCSYSGGK